MTENERPREEEGLEKPQPQSAPKQGGVANMLLALNIAALLLSMFLTSLDLTIISTAIPQITHDFQSLNDVGWYGSTFFLTMAVFQSFWGKVYKYCNLKYSFMAAVLVFELGTLGCAVSKNSVGFIAGRAVTGAGGAGIISGTYTIIAHLVAPENMPIFYGLTGIVFTVASVVGPLIGGAFTSDVTWRWCFYMNLPIGGFVLATLFLTLRLPASATPQKISAKEALLQVDALGSIAIIGSLLCFLLAMDRGGITMPWKASQPIGLLIGWILLAVCFVGIEYVQGERALVPPRFMQNRGILVCCVFIFFLNAANYLRLYYLPVYFQAIHGSSAQDSGTLLLALIVPTSVFTIIAGAALAKAGYYQTFLLIGSALVTIGSGLIYNLGTPFDAGKSVGYQILAGIGDGIAVQIPVTAVQAFVPPTDIPTVTATVLFWQLAGGVIGVAAGNAVFANRLLQSHAALAPAVDAEQVLRVGAAQLSTAIGPADLDGVRAAYLVGLRAAWILAVAFCGAAFGVGLLAPRVSILGKVGAGERGDVDKAGKADKADKTVEG